MVGSYLSEIAALYCAEGGAALKIYSKLYLPFNSVHISYIIILSLRNISLLDFEQF